MKNNFVVILLALILSVFVGRLYVHEGFPYTHDGENHLARFANYKIALKEGQIPPRIAPTLFNRYGYPVFNYNYPLPSLLSLPFSVVKINYEVTFKIIVLISLFLGAIGAVRFSSFFSTALLDKVNVLLLWFFNPYIVSTIYFRGSIGEITAYALMSWLFAFIQKVVTNSFSLATFLQLSVLWALFLLSHNSTVLIATPLLLLYAVVLLWQSKKLLLQFFLTFLLGFALTAWFWIPAVLESSVTVVTQSENQSAFSSHFATIQQLLFAPLTFGYSQKGSIDSLGTQVGLLPIFTVLFAIFILSRLRLKTSSKYTHLLFFVVICVGLLFLQLTESEWLWNTVPLLRFVQFPWRLSLIFFICLIPVFTVVSSMVGKKIRFLLALLSFHFLWIGTHVMPIDYFHRTIIDYDAYTQSTSTQNENLPKTFTYLDIGDWEPTAKILRGQGSVKTDFWNTITHTYSVESSTDVIVVEPVMLFPGWKTTVDSNMVTYIDSEQIQGRLAFNLPAGTHAIHSTFSQATLSRITGNSISILGGIILSLLAVLRLKEEVKKKLV